MSRIRSTAADARLAENACVHKPSLNVQLTPKKPPPMGGHLSGTRNQFRNGRRADHQGESGASRARQLLCAASARGLPVLVTPAAPGQGPISANGDHSITGDRGHSFMEATIRAETFAPQPLRARVGGRASGGVQLLGYDKAPDGQLVDFHAADSSTTDSQPANGKCTDGERADRNCTQRKSAYRKRAGRKGTEGSGAAPTPRRSRATASLGVLRCKMCLGRAFDVAITVLASSPARATPAGVRRRNRTVSRRSHRPTPAP